jgi:RNA polymerase sigma factor (sigma-70 family)
MPTVEAPELPALLERYERPLVRYAQSILGDLEAARDVVQDTFIRWVQRESRAPEDPPPERSPGSDPGGPLESEAPWLFTVCRNRALDYQRKNSRLVAMQPTEDRATEDPSPAATLESRDTAASLLQMMDSLSPNQREVIRLKFQSDLSYKEIAEITELSVTNVGFLLHTGLKKLRALLQECPPDDWPLPFSTHRQH